MSQLQWVRKRGGDYARVGNVGGVLAGLDSGQELYVARANYQGAIVPGKLHVTHKSVYIPYNGKEVPMNEYEVLVAPAASLSWVECNGGQIPHNAIVGGQESNGERLYVGRVIHGRTVTVGKVHPSHNTCYYSYDGKELNSARYEILVKNSFGVMLGV